MKAKSYKLKYVPTTQQLMDAGFRAGGTWIAKDAKLFKDRSIYFPDGYELSVSTCFSEDTGNWNDWDNVLVLDEEFGQPYGPFYGKNYKQNVEGFPALELCIKTYNEFMDSFDFLEGIDN